MSEMYKIERPAWVGGVLEAGGGAAFMIGQNKGRVYAYPYVQYQDNDQARVEYLKAQFGKGHYRAHLKSWVYRVSFVELPLLTDQIIPYCPSRREMFQAFDQWLVAEDRHQRLRIGQGIRAADRTPTTVESYKDLVENSEFLTGVLGARAIVNPLRRDDYVYRTLLAVSKNKTLLEALQKRYQGSVEPAQYQKRKMEEEDADSFMWSVSKLGHLRVIDCMLRMSIRFPNGLFAVT